MKSVTLRFGLFPCMVCLALSLTIAESFAQERRVVRRGPTPVNLSAEQKAAIVQALQDRMQETYTFPDHADRLVQHLGRQLASGAYEATSDALAFGMVLTDELRRLTNDVHFAVRYDPMRYENIGAMGVGPNPALSRFDGPEPGLPEAGTPAYDQIVEPLRQRNFNMTKLEVLDGNVGYMRLEAMPPLEVAQATVDAMMAFLAHTDALLIDLRGTPGGVGGFIPYLMSYFFEKGGKLLFEREFAYAGRTMRFTTYDELPAPRRPDVPLYILINATTGSAAENLAYTLQQHGRATVMGRASMGGAHSSSMMQLAEGFIAQIPIARVIHPVTQSNWQGNGVQPDSVVPSEEALAAAHLAALEVLRSKSEDARYRAQVDGYIEAIQRETAQATAARAAQANALADYEGTYGIRRVFVDAGILRYQRQGGPAVRLQQIRPDVFKFDLDPSVRSAMPLPTLRFDRNASGTVITLTSLRDDGSVMDVFQRER